MFGSVQFFFFSFAFDCHVVVTIMNYFIQVDGHFLMLVDRRYVCKTIQYRCIDCLATNWDGIAVVLGPGMLIQQSSSSFTSILLRSGYYITYIICILNTQHSEKAVVESCYRFHTLIRGPHHKVRSTTKWSQRAETSQVEHKCVH